VLRRVLPIPSARLLFMKLLRAVVVTVLITIQALFAVLILGTMLTEADITEWATGSGR
jgi:hypothetical protein